MRSAVKDGGAGQATEISHDALIKTHPKWEKGLF